MRSRINFFCHASGRCCRIQTSLVAVACFLTLAIIGASRPVRAATPDEERILLQLWQFHQTNTVAHARITEICERIESGFADFSFLPIVRSIAAWHHHQDQRPDSAINLWTRIDNEASRDPLGRAAQRMARTWLTRFDREHVRKALRRVYAKNVQYPETLEPLRTMDAAERPPLVDRWGDPWHYEWAQFRMLRSVREGQNYRLESANIRTTSDLSQALNIEYGRGLTLRPSRLIDATPGRQTLEFKNTAPPGGSVTLAEGASYQGQSLAYVGETIVVLADGDHWGIFPKPTP